VSDVPEIGLISDTHGLLRPEAVRALAGVERIIHAGDVGPQEILDDLAAVAPVTVVRGNTDHGPAAAAWPFTQAIEAHGRLLYVVHDIQELDIDPKAAGVVAVIYGHSHKPAVEQRGDTLYINPGSAGSRRFSLPITIARLRIRADALDVRLHDLESGARGEWDSYAL